MSRSTGYLLAVGVVIFVVSISLLLRKTNFNSELFNASQCGCKQTVQKCIDCGVDVSRKDENNWTPLHYAATGGHAQIVALLIANGADVNVKDNSGATPLHTAAALGFQEIVTLLLDHGAEVNDYNDLGFAPLLMAQAGGHHEIEKLLIEYGAFEEDEDHVPEQTRQLQAALESGYKEMIEAMVEHDAIGTSSTFQVGITYT